MGMQCTFSFADLRRSVGNIDIIYDFLEEVQGDSPDDPEQSVLVLYAEVYDGMGGHLLFNLASPTKDPWCWVDASSFDRVLPWLTARRIPFRCA